MKSKIIYLLVLFYAFYVAVMYDGLSPRFFFLFLLLLPLLGFCLASYLIREVEYQMKADSYTILKGEEIILSMDIKNKGFLPIPFLYFFVTVGKGGEPRRHGRRIKIYGMTDAKSSGRFTCQIQSERCGKVQIVTKGIMISDYLCLIHRRLKIEKELEVTVLPAIHQIDIKMTGKTAGFLVDGEEFSKVKSGEDPSELFDVRPYRPGDRQQKIHWKMTARTGSLMVKEFSQPIGNKVILFLDFKEREIKQKNGLIPDSFYEVILSLSHSMISEQISHYVVWFHAVEGRLRRQNIQSEADIFQMINILYEAGAYAEDASIIRQYEEIYGKHSYCTGICFDLNLYLQVGEQEKLKLPENNIKETLTEIVLEL